MDIAIRESLSYADVIDVQEHESKHINVSQQSNYELAKQQYAIRYALHLRGYIQYKPCPICFEEMNECSTMSRKCKYCGTVSCRKCSENVWLGHTEVDKWGNSGICVSRSKKTSLKKCNICHTLCMRCADVFPKTEKSNHQCHPNARVNPKYVE